MVLFPSVFYIWSRVVTCLLQPSTLKSRISSFAGPRHGDFFVVSRDTAGFGYQLEMQSRGRNDAAGLVRILLQYLFRANIALFPPMPQSIPFTRPCREDQIVLHTAIPILSIA